MRPVSVDSVDSITRKQLEQFKGSGRLQQAVKAWYDGLDDEKKREVEAAVVQLAAAMRQRCPTVFGVGSALELLAAVIAFEEGWLEIDECRLYRLRRKYERETRRLQRGD